MRMHESVLLVAFLGVVLGGPRTAEADYIDFTGGAFATADGQPSFAGTYYGIGLYFDPAPSGATLYWDQKDGFGVRYGYEYDEIEAKETLTILMTTGPVFLESVSLTDLFYEGAPRFFERGSYQLNDGAWIDFAQDDVAQAPSPGSNGEFTLLVSAPDVGSITFRAPGRLNNGQNHEYSVGGLSAYKIEVPEPGTSTLLGLGLGLVAFRNRFFRG